MCLDILGYSEDGEELSERSLKPKVIGFRIVHKQTTRILPGTTRNEVYTKAAGVKKMNSVASMYTVMQASLDIWEYELEEIYDFECPDDPIFITSQDDYLFE